MKKFTDIIKENKKIINKILNVLCIISIINSCYYIRLAYECAKKD